MKNEAEQIEQVIKDLQKGLESLLQQQAQTRTPQGRALMDKALAEQRQAIVYQEYQLGEARGEI